MKTQTRELQANTTPETALQYLKEGNARFVQDKKANRDLLEQVRTTSKGQFPFAVVLGCIDSRVPAELVFDQGIGDIFNVRIAGNIVNSDILGSLEFACKVAGARLILVLGHTRCGAVNGAISGAGLGNLTGLLQKIGPAIDRVKRTSLSPDDDRFANEVVSQNVREVADEVLARSDILAEMEAAGEIAVARAVYAVETGEVTFY